MTKETHHIPKGPYTAHLRTLGSKDYTTYGFLEPGSLSGQNMEPLGMMSRWPRLVYKRLS